MKIIVVPYDNRSRYYCIQYQIEQDVPYKRFFKSKIFKAKQTRTLDKVFTLNNNLNILDRNHPVLFHDFDTAVEFAKTLNEEKIKEWNKMEDQKYIDEYNRITELDRLRYKTMEFEV